MKEELRIEIKENGEIKVKTIGMNDDRCLDYIPIIEKMLDAQTVSSQFTEEYIQAQKRQVEKVTEQAQQMMQTRKEE